MVEQDKSSDVGVAQAGVANDRTGHTHILAADLLVVDELIAIPPPSQLKETSGSLRDKYEQLETLIDRLAAKKGMKRGDKISIDTEDFRDLSIAVAGLPGRMEAGGSTADILTTLKHLRGDKVGVDFLGIAGQDGLNDNLITEDLRKNGIDLSPGATPGARSAMSYIFTHPDGQRTTITYPGNAAEKLTPDLITDERVAKSDAAFIPISLWSKFHDGLPDALLNKSWEQDKRIIVTLPRQARFEYGGPEDMHSRLLPRADVIVADEVELARAYRTGGDIERAMTSLQADMARRDTLRRGAGKPPRGKAAVALVKHDDDSVTVLVAASPTAAAARYEIPAPQAISRKKHTLGVDDAIYAGFIAALDGGAPPQKAAEFAMNVAQAKFLYDSVRIPSPVGGDKATQQQWNNLRSDLSDNLTDVESYIGYARTGVANIVDKNVPRTPGQKTFDLFLYPLLANIGVWTLSMFVTYHSNFNQNKANAFVKRSSWFKDQLTKIPGLGKSPDMVRNLNMIIWSFVDGSLMAPVVAAFESKRQPISHWIDDRLGTTPEDKSVYDKEAKRSWMDIFKARAATFGLVIATYFTLNAKVFPHGAKEGILSETVANGGAFRREPVRSINGYIFDLPARKISEFLEGFPRIRNWAHKVSDSQLKKMAEGLGTKARTATATDARYQIEGLVNTGLFELVYTSLCTAGLFFIGKSFASKRRHRQEAAQNAAHAAQAPAPAAPADSAPALEATGSYLHDPQSIYAQIAAQRKRPEKSESHLDALDKSRAVAGQAALGQ